MELNEPRRLLFGQKSYKNSIENLREELTRIGVYIRLFLEESRTEARDESQDFSVLFISEAEVNSIIKTVCCGSESCKMQGLKSEEIKALEKTISRKEVESLKR